jgi:hypothetical protein
MSCNPVRGDARGRRRRNEQFPDTGVLLAASRSTRRGRSACRGSAGARTDAHNVARGDEFPEDDECVAREPEWREQPGHR